jgi:hypothetical protein
MPDGLTELITVPVVIPKHRLADLYQLTAEWAQAPDSNAPTGVAPGGAPTSMEWLWRVTDDDLAYQVVRAGNKNARAIYAVLAQIAGKPVSYVDLDAACGMEGHQRAGLLGSMGRACWHRKRTTPWHWDAESHTYTMPAEVGPLFLRALSRV